MCLYSSVIAGVLDLYNRWLYGAFLDDPVVVLIQTTDLQSRLCLKNVIQ